MKTDSEVEEMIKSVSARDMQALSGVTYNQGVEDALRWFLGEISDNSLLTGDED